MAKGLRDCGVDVLFGDDYMTVKGLRKVRGGQLINTFSDHRVAMSFICLGQVALKKPIQINEAKSIRHKLPSLLKNSKRLEQTYQINRTNNNCSRRSFRFRQRYNWKVNMLNIIIFSILILAFIYRAVAQKFITSENTGSLDEQFFLQKK